MERGEWNNRVPAAAAAAAASSVAAAGTLRGGGARVVSGARACYCHCCGCGCGYCCCRRNDFYSAHGHGRYNHRYPHPPREWGRTGAENRYARARGSRAR